VEVAMAARQMAVVQGATLQAVALQAVALQAVALQAVALQAAALQAAALRVAAKQGVALQAAASPYLKTPAVGVRLVVSPERRTGLRTARAKPVWVAKAKAVNLDRVAGIDRSRCSAVEIAKSPAEVPLHFYVFSVFSWGEELSQVTARAVQVAAFERLWGRRRGT
jgi:hypothetical protein